MNGDAILVPDWKKTTLGQIAKFGSGATKPQDLSERNFEKPYPVYGGNGVIGYSNQSNSAGPQVIIGRVGANCGCIHVSKSDCWVTDNALRLTFLAKEVDIQFLAYVLSYSRLENLRAQGGQPLITQSSISNIPILLPTTAEQKAIADLLSTWDEAIEKTERLIQAKEKRYRGIIQRIISRKCDSWPHVRLTELFDTVSEKGFPDEELLSVTQDRGVIPRCMLKGRVMSPEGSTANYKRIKKGDFAISLRSFQGGIEYSKYQGVISPAYTVLRPKATMDADFYRIFFKTYIFIEKYLNIAVIGIRDGKQISIPDFLSIKIPAPPLEEQKNIASVLTTAQKEIDLLKQLSEKYKTQKRGLMQKLLTGQWRVKQGKAV